jgi:predicted dehydrogenase
MTLDFPSGFVLQSFSSYGAREEKYCKLMFEKATVEVPNAYAYGGVKLIVHRSDGDGKTAQTIDLGAVDQFQAEIEHFADCLRTSQTPRTGPDQGIRDHHIMETIYRAAAEGRAVHIG